MPEDRWPNLSVESSDLFSFKASFEATTETYMSTTDPLNVMYFDPVVEEIMQI